MTKDFFNGWLERTTGVTNDKRNILVFSKWDFPSVADRCAGRDDIAFISIECTDDCAKYHLEEDNKHYLKPANNVLNIDFDDCDKDEDIDGEHVARAITDEQGEEILNFVLANLGKHFIIHCRAGASRSQAVRKAMLYCFPEYFEECFENTYNPGHTPNHAVVASIKKAHRKHFGSAFDIND